jgi:mannuronan synthase
VRDIFRKVPLSEKKALFKLGSETKMAFFAKGDSDDLITLLLDDYVDGKVLTFNYSPNSPKILSNQNIILNFSYGEDRYFLQAPAEVYDNRVHIAADQDVYILQRRRSPRLEIPDAYPSGLNIIAYQKKMVMYQCTLIDFSSGGCRAQYIGHLPLFKTGDVVRGVVHLNHRNPVELDCEIKHHAIDNMQGIQIFGIQFKLPTTILENKMLVVFMDLQRELFVKWSSGT